MPTFGDLQKRLKRHNRMCVRLGPEEMLIVDDRAEMRPGDFVEEKLRAAQNPMGSEHLATDGEREFTEARRS